MGRIVRVGAFDILVFVREEKTEDGVFKNSDIDWSALRLMIHSSSMTTAPEIATKANGGGAPEAPPKPNYSAWKLYTASLLPSRSRA